MMQVSHAHVRIFSNGCFYKTWMGTVQPHHTHSFVAMVPIRLVLSENRLPDMTQMLNSAILSHLDDFVQFKVTKLVSRVRFFCHVRYVVQLCHLVKKKRNCYFCMTLYSFTLKGCTGSEVAWCQDSVWNSEGLKHKTLYPWNTWKNYIKIADRRSLKRRIRLLW